MDFLVVLPFKLSILSKRLNDKLVFCFAQKIINYYSVILKVLYSLANSLINRFNASQFFFHLKMQQWPVTWTLPRFSLLLLSRAIEVTCDVTLNGKAAQTEANRFAFQQFVLYKLLILPNFQIKNKKYTTYILKNSKKCIKYTNTYWTKFFGLLY